MRPFHLLLHHLLLVYFVVVVVASIIIIVIIIIIIISHHLAYPHHTIIMTIYNFILHYHIHFGIFCSCLTFTCVFSLVNIYIFT